MALASRAEGRSALTGLASAGLSAVALPSMVERAERLAADFARAFGGRPDGVWAAPGRVNLIGEHTDYNAGFALPFAIEQRALVAVRQREDARFALRSQQAGQVLLEGSDVRAGRITGWARYVAGAAWAALGEGALGGGIDLLLDSDVPMGAGLSSSAAITCASLLAVTDLWGLARGPVELAQLAQRAETEIAGVPCGLMDQLASLCSRSDHALWIDFADLSFSALPLPTAAAGLELVVIDTRAPHELSSGHYAARRRTCENAARRLGKPALRQLTRAELDERGGELGVEELARARHVVSENERVLSAVALLRESTAQAARLGELGPLLSASHASLRDDYAVTVPHLDVAAEAAERAGALGARMIGGGFGGSVLALVASERREALGREVEAAFLARGWREPRTFLARPAGGAGRVI